MATGTRFLEAYHSVLISFGNSSGIQELQKQTLEFEQTTPKIMISNYLKIAWRNLKRQSFYTTINVAGLAFGLAACIVIVLYIKDELTYDTYNVKADRIYRVDADVKFGGNEFKMSYRSAPEAMALRDEYPEIESTVRFRNAGSYLVKTADGIDNIKENNVIWTDSTFFKIFSVNVLEGNAKTALTEPASIAISKRIADKYFGNSNALGQSMILDNKYNAKVTAVYENIPSASHFHFDILVSMVGDWPVAREAKATSFLSENFTTYLLLKENTNASALEAKLPAFQEKYMGPDLIKAFGNDFTLEKLRASGSRYDLSLTPLQDIHLYSNVRGDFEPNGSITYIYLFGSIAILVLAIACINFMNLSTARSGSRAKEIGVRKVMGSLRTHLIRQFLTESFLVTLSAIGLSVVIVYLFIPWFNSISDKQMTIPFGEPSFYFVLLGASLLISFLAGMYPAFFLSGFRPIQALKGKITSGMKSGSIRSTLVVFQFVISIFLIIGTITISRQLDFIQNKNLGFDKEQVIIVHDAYALRPNSVEPFRDEALKLTGIETGTISGYVPVENDWTSRSNTAFWKEGVESNTENMASSQQWRVDDNYLQTFRIKLKEGRNFSPGSPSDSTAIILNETAARRLDLGDDPIGKKIHSFDGNPDPENIITWTVIGIVEDFHFSTMKESISGLAFYLGQNDGSVSFRFNAQNASQVIQSLESIWKKLAPGQPFQYSFLDEDFERMYLSEERLGEIFTIFSGLAIVIACLGLFALTTFTAEQRTKEIGIRKVLGASVSGIVFLLSKDFGKLILIAFVVSIPVAWYSVDWWLSSYTYKTEIGFGVYLLAGVLAFLVAWITMGYQSIKAASSNPINALRSE
jgi:putative ABC transport system permease protein